MKYSNMSQPSTARFLFAVVVGFTLAVWLIQPVLALDVPSPDTSPNLSALEAPVQQSTEGPTPGMVQWMAGAAVGAVGIVTHLSNQGRRSRRKTGRTPGKTVQENVRVGEITYVGDWVKRLRGEKGYTQQQLADACGVTESTISLIERALRQPGPKLAETLGAILGVKGADIFLRAQLAKAPNMACAGVEKAPVTSRAVRHLGPNIDSATPQNGDGGGNDNEGDDEAPLDPRFEELRLRLYDLQTKLTESELAWLLATLKSTLQVYEIKGERS